MLAKVDRAMDAAKGVIESQGGTILLTLLPSDADNDFRPFETLISLPGELAVKSIVQTQTRLSS